MSQVHAAMAGTVINVLVSVGDQVTTGQDVVMLESMKMEVPQAAEATGVVKEIHVATGDFVNEGDVLISIE